MLASFHTIKIYNLSLNLIKKVIWQFQPMYFNIVDCHECDDGDLLHSERVPKRGRNCQWKLCFRLVSHILLFHLRHLREEAFIFCYFLSHLNKVGSFFSSFSHHLCKKVFICFLLMYVRMFPFLFCSFLSHLCKTFFIYCLPFLFFPHSFV